MWQMITHQSLGTASKIEQKIKESRKKASILKVWTWREKKSSPEVWGRLNGSWVS